MVGKELQIFDIKNFSPSTSTIIIEHNLLTALSFKVIPSAMILFLVIWNDARNSSRVTKTKQNS